MDLNFQFLYTSLSKLLILSILHSLPLLNSSSPTIGINYGRLADNLPPPPQAVQLLKSQGVTKVKLFDTNAAVLSGLSNSGISVTVALPNVFLSSASASPSFTDSWMETDILPHLPGTAIEAIAVGNEVFDDAGNTTSFLIAAMNNVHASLVKYNLASSIKVSSPIGFSAFLKSYPPSACSVRSDLAGPVMKPLLNFLRQTGSYLMVNIYPFFAYKSDTETISLDYALFRGGSGVGDSNNGLVYLSLFDAQIDAVYAAIDKLGFSDLKLVVTETGWPSKGDENEFGASVANAAAYNGNLVRRVLGGGGGTPLRPNEPLSVYLFALFNEYQKPGPTSERNYGLFYPNMEKVYSIPLKAENIGTSGRMRQVVAPPKGGADAGKALNVDAGSGHAHPVPCGWTRAIDLVSILFIFL